MKLNRKQIAVIIIVIAVVLVAIFSNIDVRHREHIKNGIWVNGYNMNNVNLDTLSKNSIENIFLHETSVDRFGKENVEKWIKKAHAKNISVHIWVQCFNNGTWVNPIDTKKKEFNYDYFNKKIAKIEEYCQIEGIDGIQLDYVRFPGDAYKYDYGWGVNGQNAITKFVTMVDDKIKYTNKTLSITIMPEKEDSITYYGQDVGALCHHVDVVIPMVYAGNYNEGPQWIKETSKYYTEKASPTYVCIAIQDYNGDNDEQPLNISQLKINCQSALDGGADSIAIFNWELMTHWFNLKTLKTSEN